MTCVEVRERILDHHRGRLGAADAAAVASHLATCDACAREDAAERALSELLEQRLPQHPAPYALKRRLAAFGAVAARPLRPRGRWRDALVPAAVAAALLLVAAPLAWERVDADRTAASTMVAEAVNDHLRVLHSPHPIDVESGNMHQVKPWFEGKLDFAPMVSFLGNGEFPLRGGTVGYFFGRKAAVFVYGYRLHVVTLLVFPAVEMSWPKRGLERVNRVGVLGRVDRGFNVLLWRHDGQGFALVSDTDGETLRRLAARLITPPPPPARASPRS